MMRGFLRWPCKAQTSHFDRVPKVLRDFFGGLRCFRAMAANIHKLVRSLMHYRVPKVVSACFTQVTRIGTAFETPVSFWEPQSLEMKYARKYIQGYDFQVFSSIIQFEKYEEREREI